MLQFPLPSLLASYIIASEPPLAALHTLNCTLEMPAGAVTLDALTAKALEVVGSAAPNERPDIFGKEGSFSTVTVFSSSLSFFPSISVEYNSTW